MKKSTIEFIKEAVSESQRFPNPVIEYSFELPEHKDVLPDKFFGVKARFNKLVTNEKGYQVTFQY